ncbi:MAG TPA: hypothetical protein VGG03_25190 [Thermoanaerobaculia bacterium]|jgi:hypothetical protein
MKISCIRLLILALLLLPGPLGAAQEKQPEPHGVRYEIRYMDLHAAEVLAWDQCTQKERCRVTGLTLPGDAARKGYLDVFADAATHEKIARAVAREDATPRTQRFQLLLLAAGVKAGNTGLEVPANAQKALADLKGFLPFKSYELLDTAWMSATQDRPAEAHMVGRKTFTYRVALRFRNVGSRQDRSLFVDAFQLILEPYSGEPGGADGKPDHHAGRELIDTTFGLKEGETLVVGTSKVDGAEEALVVLLTAVPAS